MIIQAYFRATQTGLGYQFYDDGGTLLGSKVTAGIDSGPETGSYVADATVEIGAVGVVWTSTETPEGISEDLREALAVETLEARVTAARAGYLDKLNVTGDLAHSDAASTYRATEPDNSGIAAIKAKTDNLPAAPAATGDIPTAAAVRSEIDSNSTQLSAILTDTGTSLPSLISALNDIAASDVRTELATELGRIDASISSRLASGDYSAPIAAAAIAAQVRIELATELARIDAAISTRLAAAGYTTAPAAAAVATAVRSELSVEMGRIDVAVSSVGGESAPSAAEIAGAVWDEEISDHQSVGSTGEKLQAAGASDDPWSTEVPGAYADGTAGAAVGRLNNTPIENPVAIAPLPPSGADLAVVYVDSSDILGEVVTDAIIRITMTSSQPATTQQGRIVSSQGAKMIHDDDNPGRYTVQLEVGLSYLASNPELFGATGKAFTLDALDELLDLAD